MRKQRMLPLLAVLLVLVCTAPAARAKVDLVTLPEREAVQLTIYNSADLTLVRDRRLLTMKEGTNELQFSWANTLIDPTSLHLQVLGRQDAVEVMSLRYPPRVKDVGVWRIDSEVGGEVPTEITAFTSGLSWSSYYLATLSEDQSEMELRGYVRVTNNSGEDYENAQTRLVVGKINLLDRIAELARRDAPYGRPAQPGIPAGRDHYGRMMREAREELMQAPVGADVVADDMAPKEIIKEGLSEYFLYTIEGTETIRDGWSKRLPSFQADAVEVTNLYKYERQRYGDRVVRFLKFVNDREHNLGQTPLPGGLVKVFAQAQGGDGHLRYVGADSSQYIPIDQEVELELGTARKVQVEPKVMDYRKENIVFDSDGDVNGFDEVKDYALEVHNRGELPVTVEITRNFPHHYWDLQTSQNPGRFQKVDQDTVKYTLTMEPHSAATVLYTLTLYQGARRTNR